MKIEPTNGQLTIIDGDNNERLCQILFTLESEEFGKKYVVFYPLSPTEEEEGFYMAASYTELDDENGELQAIETEEEWALIQDAIDQYVEENFNDCEGCEDCDDCDEDECDCSSCPHSR